MSNKDRPCVMVNDVLIPSFVVVDEENEVECVTCGKRYPVEIGNVKDPEKLASKLVSHWSECTLHKAAESIRKE